MPDVDRSEFAVLLRTPDQAEAERGLVRAHTRLCVHATLMLLAAPLAMIFAWIGSLVDTVASDSSAVSRQVRIAPDSVPILYAAPLMWVVAMGLFIQAFKRRSRLMLAISAVIAYLCICVCWHVAFSTNASKQVTPIAIGATLMFAAEFVVVPWITYALRRLFPGS